MRGIGASSTTAQRLPDAKGMAQAKRSGRSEAEPVAAGT
jgi:hypothetical protein